MSGAPITTRVKYGPFPPDEAEVARCRAFVATATGLGFAAAVFRTDAQVFGLAIRTDPARTIHTRLDHPETQS